MFFNVNLCSSHFYTPPKNLSIHPPPNFSPLPSSFLSAPKKCRSRNMHSAAGNIIIDYISDQGIDKTDTSRGHWGRDKGGHKHVIHSRCRSIMSAPREVPHRKDISCFLMMSWISERRCKRMKNCADYNPLSNLAYKHTLAGEHVNRKIIGLV